MENAITLQCPRCGAENSYCVPEGADGTERVACTSCGAAAATMGQLHALVAQQAIGLGATELRDDHVPVDGEFGERPNV